MSIFKRKNEDFLFDKNSKEKNPYKKHIKMPSMKMQDFFGISDFVLVKLSERVMDKLELIRAKKIMEERTIISLEQIIEELADIQLEEMI